MTAAAANWRERHAEKLGTPADAVQIVESWQHVYAGGWTSVPILLCNALSERLAELQNLTISTFLTPFNWDRPEILERWTVRSLYAGPYERPAVRAGRFEYVPVAQWRDGKLPPGLHEPDVALIPISPPDEDGWCSFGGAVWFGPTMVTTSAKLIGEVHPEFIRTGGQNRVHISRFERLCEFTGTIPAPPIPPRSEETELAAQVICTLVANEIVYDGATLQLGIGDVSAALPVFLDERRDLGIHTELLPGGVVDLMKKGVVTNSQKAVHTGKTVAACIAQVTPEELAFIDGNPDFELYDFTHTDDLRYLLQLENFVAVNNAMAVDLTGNVASEGHGAQVFSGPGGQAAFAVAASTAAAGSVIVLPSSQLIGDERKTRIVPGHEPGTSVTVHRAFVDYVVTEQGIAKLRGKSVRGRVDELISVAHPDFRAELRKEAARLYAI